MGVGVREDLEGPEKSFSFWNKEIWLRNEDNLEAKPQRKMVQATTKILFNVLFIAASQGGFRNCRNLLFT